MMESKLEKIIDGMRNKRVGLIPLALANAVMIYTAPKIAIEMYQQQGPEAGTALGMSSGAVIFGYSIILLREYFQRGTANKSSSPKKL